MEQLKVTIVGDSQTGKTCLSIGLHNRQFPSQYIPPVYDAFTKDLTILDKVCKVTVCDNVSEDKDHDKRCLNYLGTSTVIIVFSVDSKESFENIKKRWILEVQAELPLTPIIIVANKIEMRESLECLAVSYTEGYEMAKEMGTSYCEVSCREQQGITECLEHAIELAILNSSKVKEQFDMMSVIIPPLKPPQLPEPIIKVDDSTYASDWLPFVATPKYHDVKFILEGEKIVFSHKVFLCASSSFFRKVFLTCSSSNVDAVNSFGLEELNSDSIPGIQKVYDSEEDKEEVTIELKADIKADTFNSLLRFIYTGSLPQKLEDVDLSDLIHLAEIFEIPRLVINCNNLLTASDDSSHLVLPDSDGEQRGPAISEFFKQDLFSDIVFNVKGTKIPAHKVVVSARSKYMAEVVDKMSYIYPGIQIPAYKLVQRAKPAWEKPMSDPRKAEEDPRMEIPISDASVEVFTALLQYFYTDHFDFDDSIDAHALSLLAWNQGNLRFIQMCEVLMRREADSMLKSLGEGEVLDVFDLCVKSRKCGAFQMETWCIHYMGAFATKFEKKIESQYANIKRLFNLYTWPPTHYLNEVKDFEKMLKKANLVLTSWNK